MLVKDDNILEQLISESVNQNGNSTHITALPDNNAAFKKQESIEDRLAESEKRFETLVGVIPLPLVVVRCRDGKVIYANSKCLEIFCVQESDFLTKNFFDYFIFSEDVEEILKRIYASGSVTDKELQLNKENGEFFLASVSSNLTSYNSENVLIMSLIDISEKKKIDEEKERLLEELEISKEQIEEEAAKMVQINIQLEQSEQKLQELNAAKDKLFSIIGHDLKNPFYVISSFTEILNDDYDNLSNEERLNFIKTIGETSRFAHKLLENLLKWARSQTGRMEYVPEPLQLKKMVNDSIQLLNSQAQKKNIELSAEMNSAYMVNADKNMLDTVLRNLISNAIKFTHELGTVKVFASEFGKYIQITVADSGIGLSDDDKEKLFRIDVNNSEIGCSKEKGTGLGLILCKEFVERHEGKIWVESQFGKGSEFKFTIPKI